MTLIMRACSRLGCATISVLGSCHLNKSWQVQRNFVANIAVGISANFQVKHLYWMGVCSLDGYDACLLNQNKAFVPLFNGSVVLTAARCSSWWIHSVTGAEQIFYQQGNFHRRAQARAPRAPYSGSNGLSSMFCALWKLSMWRQNTFTGARCIGVIGESCGESR